MNLIIDIGNTRAKLALFKANNIIENRFVKNNELLSEVKSFIESNEIKYAILSSVAENANEVISFLNNHTKLCVNLNYKTKLPFKNLYKTPKTLGVDRIALMAAAKFYKDKCNTLVIDAGTCIKYDFLNNKNEYFGGAIAPGIKMRYKALNHFTERLPLLEPKPYRDIGDTTENALHNGVINGVLLELEGVINQYKERHDNLTVVLTGGDTIFLADLLKSGIFANPNFLLEGLNHILNYNK